MVIRSADQATQAIKAMQKHQENEMLLGLGALGFAGNEGTKSKKPLRDVSVRRYATSLLLISGTISQINPPFCFPRLEIRRINDRNLGRRRKIGIL
jgi:hypothetical protein